MAGVKLKINDNFPFTVLCRDSVERVVIGFGPLSRTFYLMDNGVLIKTADYRYRYDFDEKTGKPIKHGFDVIRGPAVEILESVVEKSPWVDFAIKTTHVTNTSQEVQGQTRNDFNA